MGMNLYSFMLLTEETAAATEEIYSEVANYGLKEYLVSGVGLLLVFVIFAAPLFLAVIPANIAKKKGRNFGGYYVFGYFALIPAIIVTLILKPVEVKENKTKSMSEIINGRRKK